MKPRTFEQFAAAVRDSCESHAKRKGYSDGGVDGANPVADFKVAMGIEPQHSIGEILMKCVEYLRCRKEVNLVKIAAWAYILWRYGHHDKESSAL